MVLASRSCGTKTQPENVSDLVEKTVGHKLLERFESHFLCSAKKMSQVDNCENVPMRSIGDRRYRETPKTSPVHSNGQGLPYFALICDLSPLFLNAT